MVYQQFINYPNLSVFENIASPLRIAGVATAEIKQRVAKVAALLKLENMLSRSPQELSGGQQQRTALARALVKEADLVLLDEPLANLDYKLREELREELPRIFSATGSIFVYATTEPSEALLLGGNTASLHQGRISQFGPTIEVFSRPQNLITAQTLSDPPLNMLPVTKLSNKMLFKSHVEIPVIGPIAATAGRRLYHRLQTASSLSEPNFRSGHCGQSQGCGNRDNRLGELCPCRCCRNSLGACSLQASTISISTKQSKYLWIQLNFMSLTETTSWS